MIQTKYFSYSKYGIKDKTINIQLGLRRNDWLKGLLRGIEVCICCRTYDINVWIRVSQLKKRVI